MTKQVQRRRGTATQHTSFTGAEGEISVNTTNKSVHVHDGVTAGGVEAARADLSNVSDANLNSALSGNTVASLTITSADINGGTIDGATIGGSTPAAISGTTITGTSFVTTGNMNFGDNDKAIFGAGSDLQIYHDGSNSFIDEVGTGRLYIRASDGIYMSTPSNALYLSTFDTGGLALFHNGNAKLATTATGIDVTGTVTADGLTVDGAATITDTGNVVGSNAPLLIKSNNGVATTSYGWDNLTSNYDYAFKTNGSERMRIDSSGNLLVGTTTIGAGNRMNVVGNNVVFSPNTDGKGTHTFTTAAADVGVYAIKSDTTTTVQLHAGGNSYFNGGNVGIGTSSPIGKLDVSDGSNPLSIDSSTYNEIQSYNRPLLLNRQGNNVGIGTSSPAYNFVVSAAGASGIEFAPAYSGTANLVQHYSRSGGVYVDAVNEAAQHRFNIAGTEAMRIDSSGNVGIGTSSPETTLEVKSTGSSIAGFNTHILVSDETAMAANVGGGILFEGNYTTAGDDAVFAGIKALKENATSGQYGGNLAFYTRANGSLPSEAMRIDSIGNVIKKVPDTSTNGGIAVNNGTYDAIALGTGGYGVNGGAATDGGIRAYNNLLFGTGTSSPERMRIDSSGNVGIGTSSPQMPLTVNGVVQAINSAGVNIANGATATVLTPPRGYSYVNVSTGAGTTYGLLLLVFRSTAALTIVSTVDDKTSADYSASVSGTSLQVTNSYGSTQSFYASCVNIGFGTGN
jgi:hypothetical protein